MQLWFVFGDGFLVSLTVTLHFDRWKPGVGAKPFVGGGSFSESLTVKLIDAVC